MENIETTGEIAVDAEQQGSEQATQAQPSREPDSEGYQRLKQEHRREFDEDVQGMIRERLKKSAKESGELKKRLDTLSPVLQRLSEKYGVSADDDEALVAAIQSEKSPEKLRREELVQRTYDEWTRQAQETKQAYASFELAEQVGNRKFMQLLKNGVDVRTAYEVTHRDEIIGDAMKFSAERTKQKIASGVASGSLRPDENGLRSGAAAVSAVDPSRLSKKELEEYKARARRGEKIDFKNVF